MGESESEMPRTDKPNDDTPLGDADLMKEAILEEMVGFVAELLARRLRKGEIKKLVYEVLEQKIRFDTMERLLKLAREHLRKKLGVTLDDQRANAIGLYEYIIANSENDREVLKAQEGLNDMLGLGARFGAQGGDPREQAAKVREALREMRESTEVEAEEAKETES